MLPPVYREEALDTSHGSIELKVFADREFNALHIYAVQQTATSDFSSKLASSVSAHIKMKKISIICYLTSSEQIPTVKNALIRLLSQIHTQ